MDKARFLHHSTIAQALVGIVFPRIRCREVREWPALLNGARRQEFDLTERIGFIAAVALVAWLLRPLSPGGMPPLLAFVTQFLLALPLLMVLVGPLLIRNMRRGLDVLLDRCGDDAAAVSPWRE